MSTTPKARSARTKTTPVDAPAQAPEGEANVTDVTADAQAREAARIDDGIAEEAKHQGTVEHDDDTPEEAAARDEVGDRGVNADGSPVTLASVTPDGPGRGNDQPHTREEAGALKVQQDALDQPTIEVPDPNPGNDLPVGVPLQLREGNPQTQTAGAVDDVVGATHKTVHEPVTAPPDPASAPLAPPAPRIHEKPIETILTAPEVGTQVAAGWDQRIVGPDGQVPDPESIVEKVNGPGDTYEVKVRLTQERFYGATKRASRTLVAAPGAVISSLKAEELKALVGRHYQPAPVEDDAQG